MYIKYFCRFAKSRQLLRSQTTQPQINMQLNQISRQQISEKVSDIHIVFRRDFKSIDFIATAQEISSCTMEQIIWVLFYRHSSTFTHTFAEEKRRKLQLKAPNPNFHVNFGLLIALAGEEQCRLQNEAIEIHVRMVKYKHNKIDAHT